jgi:hypothetical protein
LVFIIYILLKGLFIFYRDFFLGYHKVYSRVLKEEQEEDSLHTWAERRTSPWFLLCRPQVTLGKG